MFHRLIAGQVGALCLAALMLAAPARADDQSYMQYLDGHGYTGVYFGGYFHPRNTIVLGHAVCNDLRGGGTPELQQIKWWMLPQLPLVREAAQRELCPDTLN
ncbi:DUF732 domain-containing protein [Mycobacterium sp. E1747]|uniref:DUF732 domain-containing protein n=1 Tax=Mycobacterium sp. E1747 TaxID=1834128 RepID=UPI0007FBCCAC|nr:DUF732 domain-containing protein [Mycobacterium sp. E1747]OBH08731.1 hypothetical protein A5695_25795 [Mycobacterium sp. E1747]